MWIPDKVFGFADCKGQAEAFAAAASAAYEIIDVHKFPDGESLVRVNGNAKKAAVFRSLHHPNEKLIEIILAAGALRDQGTAEIALIAPYLPYMRQDVAFHPGEAVSQRVVGDMLARYFDLFVSVDPHLHRTPVLTDVFQGKPALGLSAAAAIAKHIAGRADLANAVILGPDVESTPLVRAVGEKLKSAWAAATKTRYGDRNVEITLPRDAHVNGRNAVVVDDVISSGATIVALVEQLRASGAATFDVYATHALFGEKAQKVIMDSGVRRIVSCDSIPHPTNGVELADVLAEGLRSWQ